jgi:hypothetical protein
LSDEPEHQAELPFGHAATSESRRVTYRLTVFRR